MKATDFIIQIKYKYFLAYKERKYYIYLMYIEQKENKKPLLSTRAKTY
jgi:hypothetical protein